MKFELICRWASCDNEYHYDLYFNGLFICSVCSFDIVKEHLRKVFRLNYVI